MKSDPTFWILARATGLAAFVLLTVSVLAGLVVKSRPFGTRLKPATATDLHRTLALLSLSAVLLHIGTLLVDDAANIGLGAVLVPGLSPYRPVATGLGVLAFELMVLVYASFSLRRRIGQKNWRRLHHTTFGLFALAAGHGLFAGSDTAAPWGLGLYLGAIGAVAAALAWRLLVPPARPQPRPRPAAASAPAPQPKEEPA